MEANDIINLPKGQAVSLIQGGHCNKLRMPLPQLDKPGDAKDISSLIDEVNRKKVHYRGDTL